MRRPVALLAGLSGLLALALGGPAATAVAGSSHGHVAGAAVVPAAHDDAAEGTSKLDLVGARFGQLQTTELELAIRTRLAWQAGDADPKLGRELCVVLRGDKAAAPERRICVVPDARVASGVHLRVVALDRAGAAIGIRELATTVRRPAPTIVRARFSPALLRLQPGLYHWHVRAHSNDVADRLPNGGEIALRIVRSTAPVAQPCFGAASRDFFRRCRNPKLRLLVAPTPDDALLGQNSPCTPLGADGLLAPCEFGVPAARARATVALLGDSHASHWRAALEVAAQDKRWRGISITMSGCPLSHAAALLDSENRRSECLRWNQQVPGWFARHPEVHTAFVVSHVTGHVAVVDGGDEFAAKVNGYIAAWKALPPSVARIVVIRDTPLMGLQSLECVRKAHARRRPAGAQCALPRRVVLRADPAVVAARRLRSRRVRVVDMTRFVCSSRQCFPVVGGALVYKDAQHLTDVFATTLGIPLRRAIEKAARTPQRRPKVRTSVEPSPIPSSGAPSDRPTPMSR